MMIISSDTFVTGFTVFSSQRLWKITDIAIGLLKINNFTFLNTSIFEIDLRHWPRYIRFRCRLLQNQIFYKIVLNILILAWLF
jgi:hypothetical protein